MSNVTTAPFSFENYKSGQEHRETKTGARINVRVIVNSIFVLNDRDYPGKNVT
jgi:hypothetical protein